MFTTKLKWLHYLPVFLIFVLFPLVNAYLVEVSLSFRSDFGAEKIIAFSFVGIKEAVLVFNTLFCFGYTSIILYSVVFRIVTFDT